MNSKGWILATALLVTGAAQATCYSVHKADGSLILETSTTPVNLAFALSETVQEKFGAGTFMTLSGTNVFCKERSVAKAREVAAIDVPVKRQTPMKVAAPSHEATDEELLALKPEEVVTPPPVQAVEVKVVGAPDEMVASDAVKAQRQMGAGAATGRVAPRQD
jgi:hypothetical protein